MIQDVNEVRTNYLTQEQAKSFAAEQRQKAVADLRAELAKEREDMQATMKLASRSGEDGETIYDFSQVDGWKDKPESERRKEFGLMNDRMNLTGAVISEKTFFNNIANNLNNANPDAPAVSDFPRTKGAKFVDVTGLDGLFSSQPEYQNVIQAEGKDYRGKTIDMKGIKGRDFMNAVFQKAGVSNSGWAPQIVRSGRVVESAYRPDQLVDFLQILPAMNGGYSWVQETALSAESATNRVPRERAEGAAAEEVTLNVTDKSVSVVRISCMIPVTEEQLADEPGARMYLEMRLPQQVRQRMDYQLINGNGTAPNMTGFNSVSGINTFAAASSSKILEQITKGAEEIWKDAYRIADLFACPMAVYNKVLTTKDTDGNYLYGDPSSVAYMDRSVWGIRMALCDSIAANTAFMFHTPDKALVMQDGIQLVYGYNSDDFSKNQLTIRCTLRANAVDFRPTSTCKITDLGNAS